MRWVRTFQTSGLGKGIIILCLLSFLLLQVPAGSVAAEKKGASSVPSFYFAEGTARPGFDPYLCIQNPGTSDSRVKITYMLGNGTTNTQDLTVTGSSRKTVRVKDFLGEADDDAHDFSAKVESTNEVPLVVERPTYFDYQGWTGGHDVMGATDPAGTFYFAEGTARP